METGILIFETYVAQQALPLAYVSIHLTNDSGSVDEFFVTDENGRTPPIPLETKDRALSLDFNYTEVPYLTYHAELTLPGFQTQTYRNIQIFAGETALLEVELTPRERLIEQEDLLIEIPDHSLVRAMRRRCGNCDQNEQGPNINGSPYVLDYPIIPKYMTVHLGRPSSNAENVTVTFKDYIKNVCSSEIFPTWPENSLRANIYCQISLAMNRVYTEWYPSQGYSFNITNSTAFDQAFVKNRNIFENISKIVDEIFNEYVRKFNNVDPFYTEYCDGRQVSCPGLKQWGTVDLANRGFNPYEILVYYYGNDIEIVTTDRIEGVNGSFPGMNLQKGIRSDSVAIIQNQLNRIAVNYPIIPVNYPVDGIFGDATEASVKAFQRQFNLTADGIVGKATWYKISYIYVAVKKLAELTSEGVEDRPIGEYPGTPLKQGSRGVYVQEMQFFLQKMAMFTTAIRPIKIDSQFGAGTKAAVVDFQKLAKLTADGIVGMVTWNAMYRGYLDTLNVAVPPVQLIPPYPGTPLRLGSRGDNVKIMQSALNTINQSFGVLTQLAVDGIYGVATQNAVSAFQASNGLVADGVIGRLTWDKISAVYSTVYSLPIAYSSENYELNSFGYQNYTSLMYDTDNHYYNL